MTTPALPPLDDLIASIPRARIPALVTALMMRLLFEPPVVVANDHGNANGTTPDEMLDVPAIAQVLRKSRRWVWRNQKKLPLRRIGRGLICSRRELDRWIAGQRIK